MSKNIISFMNGEEEVLVVTRGQDVNSCNLVDSLQVVGEEGFAKVYVKLKVDS